MSADKKPPIIKKIIKKGHGGHHGGSWKVAYADFVTAMMAFFLVMWLLAISSEQGRAALADYFNELTLQDAVFNGGLPSAFTEGGSKGPSVLDGGCFRPMTAGDAKVKTEAEPQEEEASDGQMAALLALTQDFLQNLNSLPAGVDGGEGSGDTGPGLADGSLTPGQQQFSDNLHAEIQESLGEEASGQVLVERAKGGLRIQIVDKDGAPMFSSGGPALTPTAKAILKVVSDRLARLPNKISIEGHTDALQFAGQRMTNWELSTARASAVRLYLASQGVADSRLTAVTGYAATQPLDEKNPNDPINRRVSIMIWDDETALPPRAAASGSPGAARPLPRPRPAPARPPAASPPPRSPGEVERMLIDTTMEKAAAPDLSTVGPPVPPPSDLRH
ncbi:MAG: OmpA family protein [Candidatus Adiutrix sp.]|jgi:chemotaxis protein MotB|nr:OmpA family protein [Candidatus Adiutrix sp.]